MAANIELNQDRSQVAAVGMGQAAGTLERFAA